MSDPGLYTKEEVPIVRDLAISIAHRMREILTPASEDSVNRKLLEKDFVDHGYQAVLKMACSAE